MSRYRLRWRRFRLGPQAPAPDCPFSPDGEHDPEVSTPNKCAFCGATL